MLHPFERDAALPKLLDLMLTRPAAEEATQLALCRVLALATRDDDGRATVGQLLPMLPSGEDLKGCVGLNEQRRVVGSGSGCSGSSGSGPGRGGSDAGGAAEAGGPAL